MGLFFDHLDDKALLPIAVTCKGQTQFSIAVRFNTNILDGTLQTIFAEIVIGTRMYLFIDSDNRLRWAGRAPDTDPFTTWVDSTVTLKTNFDHHAVAVFDSVTNIHALYVDGVQQMNNVDASAFTNSDPSSILLGGLTAAQVFSGILTDISIYCGTALTQEQALELYHSRMKGTPLGILGNTQYYPLADGPDGASADGDIIMDMSQNRNDGLGDNGANNTGLIWKSEEVLSDPLFELPIIFTPVTGLGLNLFDPQIKAIMSERQIESIISSRQIEGIMSERQIKWVG